MDKERVETDRVSAIEAAARVAGMQNAITQVTKE
jgi:hypothetical protein